MEDNGHNLIKGNSDLSEKVRKWLTFIISVLSILFFVFGVVVNLNSRLSKVEYCVENAKTQLDKMEKKIDTMEQKLNEIYYGGRNK